MSLLDRLLTVEQLAQKLNVSISTVRSWRYRRRISFTRIGRRLYVDAGVVETLLDANVIAALPQGASGGEPPCGKEVLRKEIDK